ncbi:MAG: hypothetical protein NVSMB19_04200 [Vulcanimicrobiaceae bacterium]
MMIAARARKVSISVGFAAGGHGSGVAYASTEADGMEPALVRVAFRCRPLPALAGRDVAYAALESLASELLRRGRSAVELRVDDPALAADIAERRPLPASLTLPYVRLRCTLNRFREASVIAAADGTIRDLTARARVEASLDVAA